MSWDLDSTAFKMRGDKTRRGMRYVRRQLLSYSLFGCSEKLEKIEELMKNSDWDSAKGMETTMRGTKYAAQFSYNHLWFRAESSGSTKEKGKAKVVFIDYGN